MGIMKDQSIVLTGLLFLTSSVEAAERTASTQRCESRFARFEQAGLITINPAVLHSPEIDKSLPPQDYKMLSQAYKRLSPSEKASRYGSYSLGQDGIGMIFQGQRPVINRTEPQLRALLDLRDRLEHAVRTQLNSEGIAFVEARRLLETHGIETTIFYLLPDTKSHLSQLAKYVIDDMDGLVGFDPTARTLGTARAEVLSWLRTFLLPGISNKKSAEIPHELAHLKTEAVVDNEESPYFAGRARKNFRGSLSRKLTYHLASYGTEMTKEEPLAHLAELNHYLLVLDGLLEKHRDFTTSTDAFALWLHNLKRDLVTRYLPMIAAGLDLNSQHIDYVTHYDRDRSSWLGSDRFVIYPAAKTYHRTPEVAPFYYMDLVYDGFNGSTFIHIISDSTTREKIRSVLVQYDLQNLTGSAGTIGPESEPREPQNGWGLLSSDLDVRDRLPSETLEDLRAHLEGRVLSDLYMYDAFIGLLLHRVSEFEKNIAALPEATFSRQDILVLKEQLVSLTRLTRKLMDPAYYLDAKNQIEAGVSYDKRPMRKDSHAPDWILDLKKAPLGDWSPDDISRLFSSLRPTFREGDPKHDFWLLVRDKKVPLPIAKAYVDYVCDPSLANFRKLVDVDFEGKPVSSFAEGGYWGARLHRSERHRNIGD